MIQYVPQRSAAKAAAARLKYFSGDQAGQDLSTSPPSSQSILPSRIPGEILSSSSTSSSGTLPSLSGKQSDAESVASTDDASIESKAKLKRSKGDGKRSAKEASPSQTGKTNQALQTASPRTRDELFVHAESSPSSSSTCIRSSKRSAAQAAQSNIQRSYAATTFDADEHPEDVPKRARTSTTSRSKIGRKVKGADAQFGPPRPKASPSRSAAGSSHVHMRRPRRFQDDLSVCELQFATCNTSRYAKWRKCVQCVAKQFGDSCRFIDFRVFPVDPAKDENVLADFAGSPRPAFISSPDPDEVMKLPVDRPLTPSRLLQVETIVAKSLLPILEAELEHAKHPNTLRRPRETKCRQMCEFCATSIFSASWFCTRCGREYCSSCKDSLEAPDNSDPTLEKRLQRCDQKRPHSVADLIPLTRFDVAMLQQELEAMRKMLAELKGEPSPEHVQMSLLPRDEITKGADASILDLQKQNGADIDWNEIPQARTGLTADRLVGSLHLRSFDNASFDTDTFGREWSYGEPLLVRNVTGSMKHSWGPRDLAARYGEDSCHIVRSDNDAAMPKEVSVGDFFAIFGCDNSTKQDALGPGSWKLKDWPPSAEFKTEFPELYEDFNRAVPAPEYTTRDGTLNLGSCYPEDVLQPDLGPKMYNAWPASEGPGGQGTTRLHMDMADAVNIMLYASPPSALDTPPEHASGVAAWDIFRAEDADKIRDFLRKEHAHLRLKDDPIHVQRFFIDAPQRVKLFREYGVKSWRIYQKQGEAVFIPAGCAHQVCNLTDCVKVAIDFVSPQNVERCFKLTAEFRELVKDYKKAWKEDVLALRTTLWYAWCTYREMSGTGPNMWAKAQAAKKLKQEDGEGGKLTRIERKVEQGV